MRKTLVNPNIRGEGMIKKIIAILIFLIFLASAAIPLPGPNPENIPNDNPDGSAISMQESRDSREEDDQEELDDINKLELDKLTLADLLKLPVRPRDPLFDYWVTLSRLVLRIYGENQNFPHNKAKIRVGTDSSPFFSRLIAMERTLHQKEIEVFKIEPGFPADKDADFVFLESKKLAKQYAASGKILIFSNKKSCRYAAFVITVSSSNKLKVRIREKCIKAQGASFTKESLDLLRRKIKKK